MIVWMTVTCSPMNKIWIISHSCEHNLHSLLAINYFNSCNDSLAICIEKIVLILHPYISKIDYENCMLHVVDGDIADCWVVKTVAASRLSSSHENCFYNVETMHSYCTLPLTKLITCNHMGKLQSLSISCNCAWWFIIVTSHEGWCV